MRISSCVKLLTFLAALICLPAWANPPTVDVVFDFDDTLVRWVRPNESFEGNVVPANGDLNGYRYRVLNGAPEMLQSLADTPGVRLNVFSLGPRARNERLLTEIKLPDGRRLKDVVGTRVWSQEDGTPFGRDLKKDLRKINPDLSRVILIDDRRDVVLQGQEDSILWVGKKVDRYTTTLKQGMPTERFVQVQNRLAFARGVFQRLLERMRSEGVSPRVALVEAQADASRSDIRYYREGAMEFHRVNPRYEFSPAFGAISIDCLRMKLQELAH